MTISEPEKHDKNFFQPSYYDLTVTISEKLVTFPGDPQFEVKEICQLGNNSHFHLNKLVLNNHLGTHIDFPSHVIECGKSSSDYLIENLIGDGVIIEVPENEKSITKKRIQSAPIYPNDIVFFKTANSEISKLSAFVEDYVYMEIDAAIELFNKKAKIVGIDYLSVDKYESEHLPVHNFLLTNKILIVENLELHNVPTGRYKIYIMPLKIENMDGLPVRIIATRN